METKRQSRLFVSLRRVKSNLFSPCISSFKLNHASLTSSYTKAQLVYKHLFCTNLSLTKCTCILLVRLYRSPQVNWEERTHSFALRFNFLSLGRGAFPASVGLVAMWWLTRICRSRTSCFFTWSKCSDWMLNSEWIPLIPCSL